MGDFHNKVGTQVRERPKEPLVGEAPAPAVEVGAAPVQADRDDRYQRFFGEKRWAANHDSFWGAASTYDQLPAGCYACEYSPNVGYVLTKHYLVLDDLLALPDQATNDILDEFDIFWQRKAEFNARKFVFKRGFLLWGPPGGGKTSTVLLLMQKLIKDRNGVVLLIDRPDFAGGCLQLARSIEKERPIICIMEDFDALVERYGENNFLSLLDGEAQVGNIVFLATTNYPERLDKRFVDRPSRFDTIKEIGMPSAAARRVYLKTKEPTLKKAELEEWVTLSEDFSIAHLKEMIIAVKCLGQGVGEAVGRLREMMQAPPKSTNGATGAGFVGLTRRKVEETVGDMRLA